MKALILSLVLALVSVSFATAQPCPDLSTVPRCLLVSPNGSLEYRVTIVLPRGPNCSDARPMPGDIVEVRFSPIGDTLTCHCQPVPGPRPLVYTATTNVPGRASFFIRGGGCAPNDDPAFPAPPGSQFIAEVFANGIKLQETGIVSPDAVDSHARTILTPTWDPGGTCGVGLADAVEHTGPIQNSTYAWCSDMDCNGVVSISDAVLITPTISGNASCPGDAGP